MISAAVPPRPPLPPGPLSPRRLRFPKAARVRRRAEYLRAQRSSARVTTAHLVLLLALRQDGLDTGTRLGLVASRKVGGAVQRNRGKRLLRELFRTRPELFPQGVPVDCVIILRAGIHMLSLHQLAQQLSAIGPLLARRARDLGRRASAR